VAAKAERVARGARLGGKIGGVGGMANQALTRLVGPVQNGILIDFMALSAQISARGLKQNGRLAVAGHNLVAILTAHPHCRMHKLPLNLGGMALQAGFRLKILGFKQGMICGLKIRTGFGVGG